MDRLCGVEAECLLGVVRAARLFRKSGRYVTDALAMSATDKVAADGGAAVERKPALSTGGLQMQAQVLMQVFAEEAGLVKEVPLVGAEGATPQGWRMLEDEPDAAVAGAKPEVLDKLNADKWADVYADALGIDPQLIVPDEDVLAQREARAQAQAQAQQQAQQMAMLQQGADVAHKLAGAKTGQANALTDVVAALSGGGAAQGMPEGMPDGVQDGMPGGMPG